MGLDMYACSTSDELTAEIDFEVRSFKELHYWRKHPNLHGWMQQLYREKGGTDERFNCVNVRLTAEDLDRLEADIKAKKLPHTEGFFFGASDGSELNGDLEFVSKARAALSEGASVYYTSWW